ncbi:MAG: 30S ribosomal protein S20 [Patescibacteria group bacterium]|jgi:small subunit ribosomal protein S20
MPVKKAAYKSLKQSKKREAINLEKKTAIKKIIKDIKKAIAQNKKDEALKAISKAYQIIDKAAKRGTIHKKTANRKKARLMHNINKLK